MPDDTGKSHSTPIASGENSHVSNPTTIITLGDGAEKVARAAIWAAAVVAIILIWSGKVSADADQRSQNTQTNEQNYEKRTDTRVTASERESRQASYWAEQMAVACSNAGVKIPPNPFLAK